MTIAVFTFIRTWRDPWNPLLYLCDEKLYTLPLGLIQFIEVAANAQGTPWRLVMANTDPNSSNVDQSVKALAEYRLGHDRQAIQLLTNLPAVGPIGTNVQAVLAMAHFRVHETDEAKAALSRAEDGIKGRWFSANVTDLGEHWSDWVTSHALVQEAEAMIKTP